MRSRRNVTLGVLIACLACLVVTVSAQKGKLSTVYWTVEIRGASDPQATIIGGPSGDGGGVGVIYDPSKSPDVVVGAAPPDRTTNSNRFELRISNAAPYAAKAPENTEPWRWITFRNVAMAADGMAFSDAFGPYSPNADRLGPVPNSQNGYDWPYEVENVNPYGPPVYQAGFMNGGAHPRRFHEAVVLNFAYLGPSFLELSESANVELKTGIAVWAKRDCGEPNNAGIGISVGRQPNAENAVITRTGPDEWRIDVNQAVKVYEYGYLVELSQRGGKTTSACVGRLKGGWWTTPLKYTAIFRRVTQ